MTVRRCSEPHPLRVGEEYRYFSTEKIAERSFMEKRYPTRKDIRLTGFNYSNSASYFITICTADRKNLFWAEKKDGTLSQMGKAADREIRELPERFILIKVDKYVIMPDHIHLILTLIGPMPGSEEKTPSIQNIIGSFKARMSNHFGRGNTIWQKRFYDHVIRNEREYSEIWEYIEYNPYKLLDNSQYKESPIKQQ